MRVYEARLVTEAWQALVHVCRRWRNVVLGSPRRLNLQLYCTPKTPVKDKLDIWPALPLVVSGKTMGSKSGTDNLISALNQSNRVCQVVLWGISEEVLAAMQVPFLELTYLQLISCGETLPVIPDSFLDGSAPRLLHVNLFGIPFPGLPKLLLSATHLVTLWLEHIHTKRSSLSSPYCPASKNLPSDSDPDPLNLSLTGKPDARLHYLLNSKGLSNI
jgi:hypothetical protein